METISNFRGAMRQDSLERFSFLFSEEKKKGGWFLCFFVVVVFPTILYLALKKIIKLYNCKMQNSRGGHYMQSY